MKFLKLLPFVSLILFGSAKSQAYEYPYQKTYFSTATVALFKSRYDATKPPSVDLNINLIHRSEELTIDGKTDFPVRVYPQRGQRAPLIFVLSGMGGSGTDGTGSWIAEEFYQQGYNAVVIPSIFNFQVVFSAVQSSTASGADAAVPGITTEDAKTLYAIMKRVVQEAKKQIGIDVSSYGMFGYSMGALHAAFIAQLDEQEKAFDFKKVLLVNPPVRLDYGMRALDRMVTGPVLSWQKAYAKKLGVHMFHPKAKAKAASAVARITEELLPSVIGPYVTKNEGQYDINSPSYFSNLRQKLAYFKDFNDKKGPSKAIPESHLSLGIGGLFRESLARVIFVTQAIDDMGVLQNPFDNKSSDARVEEAKLRYGYFDYFSQVVMKFFRERRGIEPNVGGLFKENSYLGIANYLKTANHVQLRHNLNDFLIEEQDVDFLKETFGSRAKFYPYGGHLGNLWYQDNVQDFREFFKGL